MFLINSNVFFEVFFSFSDVVDVEIEGFVIKLMRGIVFVFGNFL